LRDASSHVLGGTIGKTEEVTDLWTFVRDVKAADPNWILIETHG